MEATFVSGNEFDGLRCGPVTYTITEISIVVFSDSQAAIRRTAIWSRALDSE
jgi:hypothetical protein